MKRDELQDYIYSNGLLERCYNRPGIYAITIDNGIVYVGQSKDLYQRCSQHIYNIENAFFNKEKKYELLLAARIGGCRVDCQPIRYCEEEELREYEDRYIEELEPCLNILTPTGKNDISNLTIREVFEKIKFVFPDEKS